MVIGIIGAGLAGLVAGRELANAGHEVTVFEKEKSEGGRLVSTSIKEDVMADYGTGYLTAEKPEFKKFVEELIEKDILKEWTDHFSLYDGVTIHPVNPNIGYRPYYTAKRGMHSIIKYLSRWVDIHAGIPVGGLTHIGKNRSKKRSWILNLTDFSVFEADAVIIATPAVEAYGLIHMTQDETPSKKIISVIDEITYYSAYSLMFGYKGKEIPGWCGIEINDEVLTWITNESSKRPEKSDSTVIVAKSTDEFAKKHLHTDEETVISLMEEKLQQIFKNDYHFPEWRKLHLWKYDRVKNPIDKYFMEMEMPEAPLALIGNYFKSYRLEDAYLSGYKLARHWIDKYQDI